MQLVRYFLLLLSTANIFSMQKSVEQLLFQATRENDSTAIKRLIEISHANINARNSNGITCVYIAALNGSNDALKELLLHNADVDLPNKRGFTPLNLATFESVKLLRHAGVRVNQENIKGYTPLLHACYNPAIAQLLIEAGADANHQAH